MIEEYRHRSRMIAMPISKNLIRISFITATFAWSGPAMAVASDCMKDGDVVPDTRFVAPTTDTTPTRVVMAGRTYVIPRNYYRYPVSRCRTGETRGILLRMTLPDYLPATDETWERLYGKTAGLEDNYIQVLVDQKTVKDMKYLWNVFKWLELPNRKAVPLEGMASYVTGHEDRFRLFYDHYVWPSESAPQVIIVCNEYRPPSEDFPRPNDPRCQISFQFNRLIWQIHVARKYLANWREMIDGLRARMNSLMVPN